MHRKRRSTGTLSSIIGSTLVIAVAAFLIGTDPAPGPPTSDPTPSPSETLSTDFSDYVWPTDAGEIITSTFAEYRRAHFHGGIDISTGNDTGFRVFASREGYVSRIRVSANGYGKMLYVRHPDGYYTTYAHLKNFMPGIDERVGQVQHRDSSYIVDIECGPMEFPVERGDVIAYSGETGTGSPHLHFEIRDQNLDFVNPMLCDSFMVVPDDIPPYVRKISVKPLGMNARVNGSWDTQVIPVRRTGDGVYEVKTIYLTGPSGFAIDIRDRSPGTYYRQGIHTHDFYIDDSLFYSVKLDRAPSANSHQSGLYYDWDMADAGRGRFQRLYSDSPSELRFFSPRMDSSGIVRFSRISEGKHSFRIISRDKRGNPAEVKGDFVLSHPPVVRMQREDDRIRINVESTDLIDRLYLSTRNWNRKGWAAQTRNIASNEETVEIAADGIDILKVVARDDWGRKSDAFVFYPGDDPSHQDDITVSHTLHDGYIRAHIRSTGAFSARPLLRFYEGQQRREIPVRSVDANHWIGTVVPDVTIGGIRRLTARIDLGETSVSAFDEFELYPFEPGGSGTYFIDNGNLVLSYDSAAVLKTMFVEVRKKTEDGVVTYPCEPSRTVLNKGIIVAMRKKRNGPPAGLFNHSRRGWDLLASSDDLHNGMLTGRITQTLGEITIVADSIPPVISRIRIRNTRTPYPRISFGFGDNFSGIEYQKLIMYIDGEVTVPEIDGEHRRASYQATKPLEKGPHHLRILATDKLGNFREVKQTFTIR